MRLLLLGLMPVLVVFPLLIAVLVVAGGERADALIAGQVRGNLSGVRNYLDVVRTETLLRVRDLSRSDFLNSILREGASRTALDQALATAARGSGLDYLLVASADGRVLGSSSGVAPDALLPDSYVIRQAKLGLASVEIESFDAAQLASFSPAFPARARIVPDSPDANRADGTLRSDGEEALVVNAAAHFPLSVVADDAILVGGTILNNNIALIGHMRGVIYPVGSLPDESEGLTAIYLGGTAVAVSRQRHSGISLAGISAPTVAVEAVLGNASGTNIWIGPQSIDGVPYLMGFAPVINGDGDRIGMVAAGFPDRPYRSMIQTVLAMVIALMGVSLAVISLVYLRAGKSLTRMLGHVEGVLGRFQDGDRSARVGAQKRQDEVAALTQRLDRLLDTVARQEDEQNQAARALADEASRWRALFEQGRDGIVILDQQGRVLNANPQFVRLLGYQDDEVLRLSVSDWDTQFASGDFITRIRHLERDGNAFETTHRRKDHSRYAAEVSANLAHWSDRTFVMMSIRDISARKEADRKIKLAATVFGHAAEAIAIADAAQRILDVNAAYSRVTGFSREEVIGGDFPWPGMAQRNPVLMGDLLAALERSGEWSGEVVAARKSGESYPARLDVSAVRDEEGALLHIVAMLSDITIEVENRRRLEQFALHDPLTQLPNRRLLAERFALAQAASARAGQYGALMMIDLDNFKSLNDVHGHAAGDLLLIEVARRVSGCLREVDTVARLGGDEFVILLTGLSPDGWVAQSDARAFAEKIRARLCEPYVLHEVPGVSGGTIIEHHCSASIGISLFWGKEESLEQVQVKADEAMFLAKTRGRNGVCFREGENWPDRSATCSR